MVELKLRVVTGTASSNAATVSTAAAPAVAKFKVKPGISEENEILSGPDCVRDPQND